MKTFPHIGLGVPSILLPSASVDVQKWAVVACDQYTSEPEYWQAVEAQVGAAPSTLRITFPEVFLGKDDDTRIEAIRATMDRYLGDDVFTPSEGFVYVQRQVGAHVRRGLVVCLDLEAYDYSLGSTSLVRATEGTIVDRLPPRIKIRAGAPIESPHIMVLVDDPHDTLFGPLADAKGSLRALYDFELMQGGGHIAGFSVDDAAAQERVVRSLEALADPHAFAARYGLDASHPVLLYAMGDGNHSLATAKAIWEQTKQRAADPASIMESPLRHALVELVNLHDASLEFEPIHRVLFELAQDRSPLSELAAHYGARYSVRDVADAAAMIQAVDAVDHLDGAQHIGVVQPAGFSVVAIAAPDANLAVGTLQPVLDAFMQAGGAGEMDYVHGTDTVCALGAKAGNIGFYLPAMAKDELFKTVILDGALPRKTFSMGEAHEKRFYLECRRLG